MGRKELEVLVVAELNDIGDLGCPGYGGGEQAAGGGKKLSPVESGVFASLLHARLLGKRSKGINPQIFSRHYTTRRVTNKQLNRSSTGFLRTVRGPSTRVRGV